MDAQGNVLDEYSRENSEPFTGDSVKHRLKWSGRTTVNEIPGAVRLKFFLQRAELYGFQFVD